MQVIINVPDGSDMANQIASWQNGQSYEFTATQSAPNTFDATEVGPAEVEEAMPNEEGIDAGDYKETKGAPAHKNPAIAVIIGGKK